MSRVVSIWIAVLIATFLTACGDSDTSNAITEPPPPPPPVAEQSGPSLAEIAEGAHRSDDNKARNVFRHPVETLEFFGLKSDMRVVEIWPAGGWYTEVIAPYMQNKGKYIAAHWDPQSDIEFVRNGVKAYQDKLAVHPEAYKNVEMAVLMYPDKIEFVPPGSVDMVLTFRNIHNWMGRDFADEIFASMYAALKPGGILGVVEHRGNPEVPQDPKASSGYVNQDYAIALAEKAGFVLEATSEINANPKDRKDYATGVWTLPPTLRAGDENRDEYLAMSNQTLNWQ
jgi:predicted methyltransferase